MKQALVPDSLRDVQKFTEIVQQIDVDVRLPGRDENGSPWEFSAKSVFCTVLLEDTSAAQAQPSAKKY